MTRGDERLKLRHEARVDRVRQRVLAVEDARAGRLEQRPRLAAEVDRDDVVVGAVADRDRVAVEVREVELEAVHPRHEARERDDRRRPLRRPAAEAERPAHHRSLGEAAEDERLLQAVEPAGQELEARPERLGVGRRDPREPVPVRAARRQRERAARRDAEQPPLRIERVEERVEVVLVGAAPVQEDERSLRLAGCGPLPELKAHARGSGSGVSTGSISLAQVLEVGRQRQPLAEVLGVLVDREAGAERGELEEDPVRLAEVDRLEVEAVDHGRRVQARPRRRAAARRRAPPSSSPRRRGGPCRRRVSPRPGGAVSYA